MMRSIMNIKLPPLVYIMFFLNVREKIVPSVEKQNWAKQSTIGGGCGYPRHPGAAPAEHSGGIARITSVPGAP
jgi:hypothetical protein